MSAAGKWPVFLPVAAVLYLLFAAFPGYYAPLGVLLDDGWVYMVNSLAASKWSGVVFTYGPLGYLLVPYDIGNNLAIAIAFQVSLHLIFALLIFASLRQAHSPFAIFLFAAGYLLANAMGLHQDYQLLIVIVLLVVVRTRFEVQERARDVGGLIAGCPCHKFNSAAATGSADRRRLFRWPALRAALRRWNLRYFTDR